jgi:DNA-binding transcriptional ArsR family regulator
MSKRDIDLNVLADLFKALSNPKRLAIFRKIVTCCPKEPTDACCSIIVNCIDEFSKEFEISPSTVSHHIKELRQAGLIDVIRKGQCIICYANSENIKHLGEFLYPENYKD